MANRPSQDSMKTCETESVGTPVECALYYAVCIPKKSADETDSSQLAGLLNVYSDRCEALQIVKKNKGARFKAFKSKEDAVVFAKSDPISILSPKDTAKSANLLTGKEKPNEFKGPKTQDLVNLRKSIEKDEKEKFTELVWSNPRYLISSGDTPVILQEGFRYNALHIAAKANRDEMCTLILDTLMDPKFLYLMYPDDDVTTHGQRMDYLTDLYINMPEKGKCETPLHFASKFGNVDVVEVLSTYPALDRQLKNSDGHTASEIACSRSGPPEAKDKIVALLKDQYYVPLLRAVDNATLPVIGEPWSPDTEIHQTSSPLLCYKTNSPIDSVVSVKAYAGPMSSTQAEDFHKTWKTPPRGSAKKVASIKRSDIEKGLERLGRDLAQGMQVPWIEFWDFLGCYADLSSEDGLNILENYLAERGVSTKDCHHHQTMDETSPDLEGMNEHNQMKSLTGSLQSIQLVNNEDMKVGVPSKVETESFSSNVISGAKNKLIANNCEGISSDVYGFSNIQKCLKFTEQSHEGIETDKVDGEQRTTLSCLTTKNQSPQSTCQESAKILPHNIKEHCQSQDSISGVDTIESRNATRTTMWGEWRTSESSTAESFSSSSSENNSSFSATPSLTAMKCNRTDSKDTGELESVEGIFGKLSLSDSIEDKADTRNLSSAIVTCFIDKTKTAKIEEGDIRVEGMGEGDAENGEMRVEGEGMGEGDADNGEVKMESNTNCVLSTITSGSVEVEHSQSDSDSSHYTSLSSDSDTVYMDAQQHLPSVSSSPGSHGTPAPTNIGFTTPQTFRSFAGNSSYVNDAVFLEGTSPTKLDLDVLRAIGKIQFIEKYPHIHKWKQMVESFPTQIQVNWPSPAVSTVQKSGSAYQQRRQTNQMYPFWNSSPLAEFRFRHIELN
ncbi:uncharacterized protein LOC144438829 isoform X2 [Glandiceps talaboti]